MPSTTSSPTAPVFAIELTDEDLTNLPDPSEVVEIDDVCNTRFAGEHDDYDLVEIELTPEEMDKLLSAY